MYIGTSGWAYDHWQGPFYPEGLAQERRLAFYAERFRSVEINNSFYHLPEKATLRSWYDTVPDDFVFAVKASRYLTHMKKLKDPAAPLATLLERIRVLDDKLGPILFQLPPHWRFNAQRLAAFLQALSGEFRYAFEFRDHSWLTEQTLALLGRHQAAFCIYDLDGFLSPREVTSDLVYVRLHGPGDAYQGRYDKRSLAGWAGAFSSWSRQGRRIHCYFDNDQAGYAAQNARELQVMLSGRRSQTE